MRYDITLYVGHNVNGVQTWTDGDVVKCAHKHGIMGATAISVMGIWNGEIENTTMLEICDCEAYFRAHIETVIVPAMCADLQQQEIMFKCTESHVRFITA